LRYSFGSKPLPYPLPIPLVIELTREIIADYLTDTNQYTSAAVSGIDAYNSFIAYAQKA
jgi:hypothetical protein